MKSLYRSLRVSKKSAKPGDLIKASHEMAAKKMKKTAMKKKYKKMSMDEYEMMDKPYDKMYGIKEGSMADKKADKMSKKGLEISALMKKKAMKKKKMKAMKHKKMAAC